MNGNVGVAYIECVNPKKDKWKIRWAIADNGDGTAVWMEEDFSHKPTADEIRDTVIGWYNDKIDNKILSGFVWNGRLYGCQRKTNSTTRPPMTSQCRRRAQTCQ